MGTRVVPVVTNAPILITNTGTQMTFTFDGRQMSAGSSVPQHDFEFRPVVDTARAKMRLQSIERVALTSPALPGPASPRLQLSYNIGNDDLVEKAYSADLNRPECGMNLVMDGNASFNLEETSFVAVGVGATFTYPAFPSGTIPNASSISIRRRRAGVDVWLINGDDGSNRAADFTVNTTTRLVTLSGAGNTVVGDTYSVIYNRFGMLFQLIFRGNTGLLADRQQAFYISFDKGSRSTAGKAGVIDQVIFYGGRNGQVSFREGDQTGYPGATLGSVTTTVIWFNGGAWPIFDTTRFTRDGLIHSAANPIGYSNTPGGVSVFSVGFPVNGGLSTDPGDLSVYVGGGLSGGLPTGGTKLNPFAGAYTLASSPSGPGYGTLTFTAAPAAGFVYWKARNNNNLQILSPEDGATTLLLGASGGVQSVKIQAVGSWDQKAVTPSQFTVQGLISVGPNNDPGLSGDANPTAIVISRLIGTGSPRGTVNVLNIGGTALPSAMLAIDGTAAGTKIPASAHLLSMSASSVASAAESFVIYHTDYSTKRILLDANATGTQPYFEARDASNQNVFAVLATGEMRVKGRNTSTGTSTALFGTLTNKPGASSVVSASTWLPVISTGVLHWVPAWID